jgi:lysozyme family protein
MAADNFDNCLKLILEEEGGNDDDPLDHGGRTSRGITQREYNAWRSEHGEGPIDVWTAPQEDIVAIYHEEYWQPWCDSLPVGVDYLYFDMAVNAGPHEAAILLQRALGVTADGRIGPVTRTAIATADPKILTTNYTAQKDVFYRNLHQPHNLRGWLNRNKFVAQNAIKMLA